MSSQSKIDRLAGEATELNKAWVIAVAIVGRGNSILDGELIVPDYFIWPSNQLKKQIPKLEMSLDDVQKYVVRTKWSNRQRRTAIPWLAKKYDEWMDANQSIWELGRVAEVESALGALAHRKYMECPVYAQVLLQGFQGAAIRHPEYHHARDLALHYNLFLDAEAFADGHLKTRSAHGTEVNQSLARSTILSCYNLLESFVSGLAAEYIVICGDPDGPGVHKFTEKNWNKTPLRRRFAEVPCLITRDLAALSGIQSELDKLFGIFKRRRDSYVHCEPGTKHDVVKETFFHETDITTVKETVTLTTLAIKGAWQAVHGTVGPRWLVEPDQTGRFPKIFVKLMELPPD